MIARIWHSCTDLQHADAYETLLRTEIFKGIKNRKILGFIDIQLLKSIDGNETEFITIMRFENLDGVKIFAGENYQAAIVPEAAQRFLKRNDKVSGIMKSKNIFRNKHDY